MTTLRFAIAALPCLLVPRPKVSWPVLIAISFTLFLGQFLAQAYGIAHGVPVGLSSVIVQSQALFTIASCRDPVSRELPTPLQGVGIGIAVVGLLMICGTVGYDFSVGAFAVIADLPDQFCDRQSVAAPRATDAPMFDLFAWLCLVAAIPLVGADALVLDGPQATWHALRHMSLTGLVCMLCDRRHLDLHRLLAVGPAAARLPRRAGGAVRAAGAVRGLGGVQHRVRRALRAAAAGRNDHRRLWNRRDAVGEAAASDRKAAPARRSPERKAMSQSLLLAFLVFISVMFFTPGPNNIMLLSSGLTYGFRRTLPHMAGVDFRRRLHGRRGRPWSRRRLHRLSGAEDHSEICRRRLSDLSCRRDRDVRRRHGGPGQPARPDDLLGCGDIPMDQRQGAG